MNNQHFEQYLAQIRQTDSISDLPEITIHIHRPLFNFDALLGVVFGIPLTVLGIRMIFGDWRFGLGWIALLAGLLLLGMVYEQKQNHKFSLSTDPNSYFLQLTPDGLTHHLDDQTIYIPWQNFSSVETFGRHKTEGAHITIFDKSLRSIAIYHDNLPIHYKKLALLIHDYHLKATGRRIILIK
ncbi:hypothetical protein [Moraxella pluranimalium]|uniref:Uncharacterized protein n=2 Tax=Moraxellaceae TaxID=468 RepID=A0A1T0CUW1_9GAMM|nr:hypothetical protein [Moraxella pluranimalium]OOS25921.1 hypothetical protein B0680_00720 [Moraxella pluranimalium]